MSDEPNPSDERAVLYHWSARTVQPITVLYVAVVFGAFMALAYFGLDSMTGVTALAMAAVAAIVALIPSVLGRIEYQLTGIGLEKRPLDKKKPGAFKEVFRWDQLEYIVPMKHGFKFYKPLNVSGSLRRFWRAHVSDAFSGEVHLESTDRERVLGIVADHGIPTSRRSETS